jgi:hypothetical protein
MPGVWGEGAPDCHLPKVRYAKRILKCLDQALKGGYKPKEERKDKGGKPKWHLRVLATKEGLEAEERQRRRTSEAEGRQRRRTSEAEEEDISEGSSSGEDKGE